MDKRAFPPSAPAGRPGSGRPRSGALVALGALLGTLLFLLEAALVLRWLDPAVLAHPQVAPHNRPGRYGALLAIVVVNALLACGAQLELSAPRTRFEHIVNVLALPFFAAFCDTLILGAFADPDLPNARIGALVVIALCFANLSMGLYIWGLWWALRRPFRPPSALPPAGEAEQAPALNAAGAMRPKRWVWETPPASERPIAPVGQVALLGLTLAFAVAQVVIIGIMQAPQASDSLLLYGLAASFASCAVVIALFLIVSRRAAPMLPHLRRL